MLRSSCGPFTEIRSGNHVGMSSLLLKDLQSGGPWHPEEDPYELSAPQDHPSLLMKPLVFKSPEESGLGRQDGRECSFFVRLKR